MSAVFAENELAASGNLEDGEALSGSGVIVPKAHRETVFAVGGQFIPHAHLHVLLRFADEPRAGQGIRWSLRQPDNRRADPCAPGSGRRDIGVID